MITRRTTLSVLASAPLAAQLKMGETSEGFVPLFNGRDLGGWEGDERLWKVEGNTIVGSTEGVPMLPDNTFLVYTKEKFQDFELRFQVKLRNHNSGVQFRSEVISPWVVKGLQADLAEGNYWGSIYDEKGTRGLIVNGWKEKAEKVVKPNDFNDYTIFAKGGTVRLTVNDVLTAEVNGETPKSGIIALQLHKGPPMRVDFRMIRLRKL